MDVDAHFLNTVEDLWARVQPGAGISEYEALQSSKLLRLLLLDGFTAKINQSRRLKLRFEVNWVGPVVVESPLPRPENWQVSVGIDPGSIAAHEKRTLTLDAFLAHPVALLGPDLFTVRDLIDVCANTLGGVHVGKPRTPSQVALAGLEDKLRLPGFEEKTGISGLGSPVRSLIGIGRVTVAGLLPLAQAVTADMEGSTST